MFKFGKKAPIIDARTFRMAGPLAKAVPVIPRTCNWAPDARWRVLGNDTVGNCSQVSVADAIQTWTRAAQSETLLTEDMVMKNYSDQSGYEPGIPASDHGAALLDVLKRWLHTGYVMPGTQPGISYLTAFGAIAKGNQPSVQRAIAGLGAIMIGAMIPARYASTDADIFDFQSVDMDAPRFGHAMACHGFDADGVYVSTWGKERLFTWSAFSFFCDEAYALVSRQHFLSPEGLSPINMSVDDLIAEMRASA